MKTSPSGSHQPSFICSVGTTGQQLPYWMAQIQNISIIAEVLLDHIGLDQWFSGGVTALINGFLVVTTRVGAAATGI